MDAPNIMISGLQERLPAITSCLSSYAEKHQFFRYTGQLKIIIIDYIEEAHSIANNHSPHLSQVSILFRNTVVQYQKTVQVFLDSAIKVLRETQVKLPGSKEMSSLIEVVNKLTISITTTVQKAMHMLAVNVEYAFNVAFNMISKINVTMHVGDVMAGAKIIDQIRDRVKMVLNPVVDFLKQIESVDMLLEKLGDTLKFFVDQAQDFVDNTLKSDFLGAIAVYMNALYDKYLNLMKIITNYANTAVDIATINGTIDYILETVRSVVNQFNYTVTDLLKQAPAHYRSYIKVQGKRLEINL